MHRAAREIRGPAGCMRLGRAAFNASLATLNPSVRGARITSGGDGRSSSSCPALAHRERVALHRAAARDQGCGSTLALRGGCVQACADLNAAQVRARPNDNGVLALRGK